MLQVFSICSANYMPFALTLYKTLKSADPGVQFTLFLADDVPEGEVLPDAPFDIVRAVELGIPSFWDMAFRYTVMEFNTAIKPFCFQWLLERFPSDPVVYLDPDIFVLAPLDALRQRFNAGAELILTPHSLSPLDDGYDPDDRRIMQTGAYNLGFAAVRKTGAVDTLIDWWASHMQTRCVSDLPRGLFVDQKFMDIAPAFVTHTEILRHSGYNVAYWNLHERRVSRRASGEWSVGSDPLVFFHFSGVDRANEATLSRHQNRFNARNIGELKQLLDEYRRLLETNDDGSWSDLSYAYGQYGDGAAVPDLDRFVYRRVFTGPQPIDRDYFAKRDRAMLHAPTDSLVADTTALITRYMHEFWRQRADLRAEFNLKSSAGVRQYAAWYSDNVSQTPTIEARNADAQSADVVAVDPNLPTVVNVVGYAGAASGLGTGVRSQTSVFFEAGIKWSDRSIPAKALNKAVPHTNLKSVDGRVLYLHVNADQTLAILDQLTDAETSGRYKIGYWAWELPNFPDEWCRAFQPLHEIWAPSQFVCNGIQTRTDKPVIKIPHAVRSPAGSRSAGRAALGIENHEVVIGVMFDTRSFMRRKNPLSALQAFEVAFPRPLDSGVRLVLKGHGPLDDTRSRTFYARAASNPGVIVRHQTMAEEDIADLKAATDILLSPHRSEGFGLNIAEAMAAGKVAVATGWSGNMEFMNAENSVPLDYELRPLAPGDYPHAEGQHWAEPSHEQMVEELRSLVADPARRERIGQKAASHMAEHFSVEAIAKKVKSRMDQIFTMTSA
ncbi:MAG: glycosyltransferase family 4 protein [Parvularculaceae bacterium]|nr:glycosyltransferase family 4 protein [Parvularculaceae bacterium]